MTTPFMDRVGYLMVAEEISQSDLARMTGLSQATISRLLQGKTQPSLDTAEKIARATGVSLDCTDWDREWTTLPGAGDSVAASEEAWSTFYNSTEPAFRQYMFRDQFMAGFKAGASA